MEFQKREPKSSFVNDDDTCNDFVSTCAVAFRTKHEQNKARGFDNEGFTPVAILCGVVGSPYLFTQRV